MKKVKTCFLVVLIMAISFLGLPVFAAGEENVACTLDPNNPACQSGPDFFETFQSIMNVVLAIVGIVATIMIIIAGITMATSQGDAAKVKKARNTILYSAIGMIIALAAYGIVHFVVMSL